MLSADDYHVRYYSSDRRALQLSKYYLGKWGKIEKNVSQLSEAYSRIAFILFSALKEMTDNERKFLADKYRVTIYSKIARPDREVAEEYEMNYSDYQKLRKGVEYKFYSYLKPLIQKQKEAKGLSFSFGEIS